MIKRIYLKKFSICIISMIAIFLFCIFPKNDKLKVNEEINYIDKSKSTIFLLDRNDYVAMTSINLDDKNIKAKARKLLTALIQNEKYENSIPNGFKNIIPQDTKILNIGYKDNVLKVDFSKDLLNTNEKYEQKIIEAIVYTLTSIKDIKYVIIYVEGELLTHLPKSNINIPSTLDRSFGINKVYNITSDKDITKTTIYYMNEYNDNTYYIPVTKINNSKKDKANIIVEELRSIPDNNLTSYLNNNTEVVSITNENKRLSIDFNESIYNDKETKEVLSEVIDTLYLSMLDNYDVEAVTFTVDKEEFYKSN